MASLKPECTRDHIDMLCQQAIELDLYAVCVAPYFVQQAARILEDYKTKVCTVIGFPYGYHHSQVKAEEIKKAIDEGVEEVDVVTNIAAIKSGDWSFLANDTDAVVRVAHLKDIPAKLIIEYNLLQEDEIRRICDIAVSKEVDFIKTGTGTVGRGVQVEDILFLRSCLPNHVKIKASGGIKTHEQAIELVEAGASRIGTSNVKSILIKD